MNLKLRRLVRTPSSEQYALFDLDRTDADYAPLSVGKLDLHYTQDGVYGTFLFWQQSARNLSAESLHSLAEATVREVVEPMGIPAFYAVEFFYPGLDTYALISSEQECEDA